LKHRKCRDYILSAKLLTSPAISAATIFSGPGPPASAAGRRFSERGYTKGRSRTRLVKAMN